jgi:hypothetical protein
MANEFKHKDPGTALTQAEFIASDGTGHIFDSQAAGDVLYASSTTVLARLAKATDGNVLELASGLPAWTGSPNLTALTVDDVAIDGKVITMTGSSGDTAVFTVGANGTLSLVTVDTAAAAANIQITADGTVDIDSVGVLTLDSGAAINIEPAAGSAILLDGNVSIDGDAVTGIATLTASGVITAGGFTIGSAAITEAELEILDGATVTTTELNVLDALDRGSILYGNASSVTTVLGQGGANEVLTSDGTDIAWAAAAGGPSQANQAALEAETDEDTYAPPDLIRHSPGVAKVWAKWEQTGGHTMSLSYNMTSVTDGSAAGDTDHVFATDFSGTNWIFVGTAGNGEMPTVKSGTEATGTLTTITRTNSSASAVDSDNNFMAMYGDQ